MAIFSNIAIIMMESHEIDEISVSSEDFEIMMHQTVEIGDNYALQVSKSLLTRNFALST